MQALPPLPYQAIGCHSVIGDRRTAALVAADGTLDWLCLPSYDGLIACGALLDADRGGYFRLGPAGHQLGTQRYRENTAILVTTWDLGAGTRLELTDFMAGPEDRRTALHPDQRMVVRRLRCLAGRAFCGLQYRPAIDFKPIEMRVESPTLGHVPAPTSLVGQVVATVAQALHGHGPGNAEPLWLWLSRPLLRDTAGEPLSFVLSQDEELWAVLVSGQPPTDWSALRCHELLAQTDTYWRQWVSQLDYDGPRADRVRLSALLVHLLSYAPNGSVVAAPTTSLPERIGGDWNADYRLTWVRDTSLSLEMLSQLGNTSDSRRFLEWLCGLRSATDAPVQVVYGVRGETDLRQREDRDLFGYRGSRPVRFGNHAANQTQLDSLGYLLHGVSEYRRHGGVWEREFWGLVQRVADYLGTHWQEADNSIWELSERRHFISGKVMSALGLDRAATIADELGHRDQAERWRATRDAIRTAILKRGWSERLGAFRQHYDADNLDAAALLIPALDFLPAEDPRVLGTVEQVAHRLGCDGYVYRFDPKQTPGVPTPALPLGEFEGAFLPCTFWLATAYAKLGRREQAEAILRRAEECAGSNGLFAEAIDPRTRGMRGNYPLLFSHAAYIRAVRMLAQRT